MSRFFTADNRPVFQWNMDIYGRISNLYLLQLCFELIYFFIDIHDGRAQSWVSSKVQILLTYYFQINMSQICTLYTKIQGYHLTRLVWRTRIIFRFFSYVAISHLLQRQEDVGICWNYLQIGFPWSSQVTNGLEYYLLFQIPNLESSFEASLE